jgi:hypothetical protein
MSGRYVDLDQQVNEHDLEVRQELGQFDPEEGRNQNLTVPPDEF